MTAQAHPPVISVMLAVPDATAAARWYARALGATELWNLGGVVGLAVAGAPFFLGEPENNGWDTPATLGSWTVSGRRKSLMIQIISSAAPWRPEPTAASTRSVTTRRHGAFTGKAAGYRPAVRHL